MNAKKVWIQRLLILSVALYFILTSVTFVTPDWLMTIFVAWLASPILFFAFAYIYECEVNGRGVKVSEVFNSVFSLKTQAYSFIIGDLVLLPAALATAAYDTSVSGARIDYSLWWWWVLSLIIGILAGFGWHFKLEKPGYESAGYADNLNSPTKLFHDFVSYPVLFGGIAFVYIPMWFHLEWNFIADLPFIVVSLAIIIWLVLGAVVDSRRAKTLSPWGHPAYDLVTQTCLAPA